MPSMCINKFVYVCVHMCVFEGFIRKVSDSKLIFAVMLAAASTLLHKVSNWHILIENMSEFDGFHIHEVLGIE